MHFWCSIRKLIFLSKVMGIALTGMLTRPMLMLPDQVGWLGIGSRFSSSSAGATSSLGDFNLGISYRRQIGVLLIRDGDSILILQMDSHPQIGIVTIASPYAEQDASIHYGAVSTHPRTKRPQEKNLHHRIPLQDNSSSCHLCHRSLALA